MDRALSRAAAPQVLSFPAVPDRVALDALKSLRARCKAAEEKALAAAAAESRARDELLQVRQACQQMLEASALELLELKRQLQRRDQVAVNPSPSHATGADLDEIAFDQIEAALAASPL